MRSREVILVATTVLLVAGWFGRTIFEHNAGDQRLQSQSSETIREPASSSGAAISIERPANVHVVSGVSPSVFSDVESAIVDNLAVGEFLSNRPIGRYRIVNVDADYLRTLIRESTVSSGFEVTLMDDISLTLKSRVAREVSSGWETGFGSWIGTVEGDELSRASIVIGPDNSVSGVIRTRELGRIRIEKITGTPHHVVWTLAPGFQKKID